MNTSSRIRNHWNDSRTARRILAALSLTLLVAVGGCSDDTTAPTSGPSPESEAAATDHAQQILEAEQLASRAAVVEDLVGGFAVGLADESAGLDMEIGGDLGLQARQAESLSAGHRVAAASRSLRSSQERLRAMASDGERLAKAAPGDLLYSETVTNPNGSVTRTEVYQDEPEAVVRVLVTTTWPDGNLLLVSTQEEIVVDRGADFGDESDDTWLSLSSRLDFTSGASLVREVDAREQGGLQDGVRVDLVSTWTPRPAHPRWVETVTTLTVDLGQLDDESDDRFVGVERVSRFTGTAFDGGAPRVVENLSPETPVAEGEEPCGGELSRDVYFRADRQLRQRTDRASWACEGGGSLSRRVVHADGSEDVLTLTEGSDGIVHLDATRRDGTSVSGSYDEAAHSFEVTTSYPTGHDPVQESLSGSTNADETAWQLDATSTWADGFVETAHLQGREDGEGKHLSGEYDGRDEAFAFSLDSNLEETLLVGHLENDQEQVLDFELEELPDGSHLVDFVATEPGLRVVGHLEIDPLGCGEGTLEITEDGATATIELSFCDAEIEELS